jgi:eukaryotic translation initiation factor 2C
MMHDYTFSDTISRFFSCGHHIMYVGADLSHLISDVCSQISVVAVVASADDVPNRYFKEVYKQERPSSARGESREYIVSMREIMKSLIGQYEQYRGYPPSAIIIYRDGISESEFDTVFEKELTATRHACADLSPIYRPHLTYIVMNKRHHTRLFPTGSDKNVSAGTVIDSHDITNATTYDFYLNSHYGALVRMIRLIFTNRMFYVCLIVKGTSRPTHYHVLYDDNNLKPDEMQMLTYALCYTYARCTRAVSIPAPVKYADLLAFRATYYLDSYDGSDT